MLVLNRAMNMCSYRTSTSDSKYCEVDIDGTSTDIRSSTPHFYDSPDGADTQRGLGIEVR